MARRRKTYEPLPTIWEVNDELWSTIENILGIWPKTTSRNG